VKPFGKALEEKAKELAARPAKKQWEKSIPAMLRREIALTVDQIKRLRERNEQQLDHLLKLECNIDTELMQMRDQPHQSSESGTLKQRLFDIEKERRRLSLKLEEKTQSLEERLLSLVNKHEQIDTET